MDRLEALGKYLLAVIIGLVVTCVGVAIVLSDAADGAIDTTPVVAQVLDLMKAALTFFTSNLGK